MITDCRLYLDLGWSADLASRKDRMVSAHVREMGLFAAAGSVGFLVDASTVTAVRHWTHLDLFTAKALGFSFAVTVTWLMNRRLAFSGRSRREGLFREWLRYVSANGVGGVVNNSVYVIGVLTVREFAEFPAAAIALGSLAGMCFNYAVSRWWVFRGENGESSRNH